MPFFFFNDTATTEIYTLSLHDALPISVQPRFHRGRVCRHTALPPHSQLLGLQICNLFPDCTRETVTQAHHPLSPIPKEKRRSDRKSTRLNSSTPISRMPSSA